MNIDVVLGGQSPLSTVALALGGLRMEDRIWQYTLRALAADHGVVAEPTTTVTCLDRRPQWRSWHNLRHDALLAPLRKLGAGPTGEGRPPSGATNGSPVLRGRRARSCSRWNIAAAGNP